MLFDSKSLDILQPSVSSSSAIMETSAMSGTFLIVELPGASSETAINFKTEFLAPEI